MMPNKNTQIRNKMIKSYPNSDRGKLAELETFLHEQFPECTVFLEPWLLFTKGEDEYIGWNKWLVRKDVERYNTWHPDILLFLNFGMIILELDGAIHDIKVEKTKKRNRIYEANDLSYIVINETNLKHTLGMAKSAKLSQNNINQAFLEELKN